LFRNLIQDVTNVTSLFFKHVREVHSKSTLHTTHDETVRESATVKAMESTSAIIPVLSQRLSTNTIDFVSGTATEIRSHFKTSCVNQTINFIFDAIGHHTFLGDVINASTIGINEFNSGAIKGCKIVIVETRTLAELAIPRLEMFSSARIAHNVFDSRANLFHLFKVGKFKIARQTFRRQIRTCILAQTNQ